MCRAIWLVRTGNEMVSFLNPKYEPTKTSGVLTPNHSRMSASRVVMGVAVEDPSYATKLRK